ncbi:MAG: hypothetical protein ACI9AR_000055 [Flavobacteriaceae bacterium]|jgi:hypothetical protein
MENTIFQILVGIVIVCVLLFFIRRIFRNPYLRFVKKIGNKFRVYEMYNKYNKSADFKTLFVSLCPDLVKKYRYKGIKKLDLENEDVRHEIEQSLKKNNLAFESQEQLETFCQENKQWLLTRMRGKFFLFTAKVKGEEKFFVACVNFVSGELNIYVRCFSSDIRWPAHHPFTFVVPCQASWWCRLRHLFS